MSQNGVFVQKRKFKTDRKFKEGNVIYSTYTVKPQQHEASALKTGTKLKKRLDFERRFKEVKLWYCKIVTITQYVLDFRKTFIIMN